MSVQQPSVAPNHRVSGGPSSSVLTPHEPFVTSEFRNRVVEILSKTANGCLQELDYRPGMPRDLADVQTVAAKFRDENQKLFEDNRRLALMVKDIHAKQTSVEQLYKHQVQALEQQIATLRRENQAILARGTNLAAGRTEYAHLQEECLRLRNDCAQLKQHIIELQVYIPFPLARNSNLTQPPLHQQNRAVTGGQPAQARIPQSVQDPLRRQQQSQLPAPRQIAPSPQNVSQSQCISGFHPGLPSIIIPNAPRPFTQVQQGNQSNGSSPVQHIPVNQDMSYYRPPVLVPPRSASSASQGSAGAVEINAQGPRMSNPSSIIPGWASGAPSTGPHPVVMTGPHKILHPPQNPPGHQVSAPSPGPKPQLQPHPPLNSQHIKALPRPQSQNRPQIHVQPSYPTSAPSSVTVSPTVPGSISNSRVFNPMTVNTSAGVPFINPPQGVPTFVIGPPGRFLPSLAAYTKVPSPSTSSPASGLRSAPTSKPTSRQNSPTSAMDLTVTPTKFYRQSFRSTEASSVPQTQSPADFTPSTFNLSNFGSTVQSNSSEHSHTPHLTPSSSRGSAGPSEGVSEAMTPLDVVLNNIINVNVAESPTAGGQTIVREPHAESTIAPSLLMKRPSVHMDADDEVEVPPSNLMRKKPRLDNADEPTSSNWQTNTTVPTPDPTLAPAPTRALSPPVAVAAVLGVSNSQQGLTNPDTMDEDDGGDDDDDDDEIGPDGTRSIRSCLDIFTEEDENGMSTCSLCISRHHQGLIAEPISFAPDATQEEKVQHFLDEHPTSWDNLLHGTIAPVPG